MSPAQFQVKEWSEYGRSNCLQITRGQFLPPYLLPELIVCCVSSHLKADLTGRNAALVRASYVVELMSSVTLNRGIFPASLAGLIGKIGSEPKARQRSAIQLGNMSPEVKSCKLQAVKYNCHD